jgi:capsular exopolysaccharide synthesis family protein
MDSPYVTEARRLLQALARQGLGVDRKSYLVTSAGRSEGKSTACALLSVVAAQIFRKRVVVVDADFRRPTMHRLLDIPQSPGFCEILQRRAPLDLAIRTTCYPNLFGIPSGLLQGNVAEAYDDESFRTLIQTLRGDFDLVLVDSAPAVPVVEPLLMAEHVDNILIVTMAGRTPLNMLRRMKQILAPVSSRIAGVILNNAAEGLPYYYDYRYYGYEPAARARLRGRRPAGAKPQPDRARLARPAD